ncbi:LVIVD repeat-containing protein [Allomuricauda sp. SCSIO 65647]|uniref:LVIVD repeat-containing protein n=1 Tax=Allomuricauda sp. SCSIO 65647 TaxID=2908843 RepID=UPI001F353B50|nr:hypothetical protein [Muricauda sp. SCSIO 65647]UJH66332.1 hypothetical protein L0P89_10155 [Muricauda sp. SCSIO 65647]
MKRNVFLTLFVAAIALLSCEDDENGPFEDYLVARPLTISKTEFRESSVTVVDPLPIDESGKMYAYKDYIFVNDKYKGVHVIDNSSPENPQKVSFIKIAGNVDISIKDDYLYADSLTDLVVLDISDVNNVTIVDWLEGVLGDGGFWLAAEFQNIEWPQADIYDYDGIDFNEDVIVGWQVKTERRPVQDVRTDIFFDEALANDAGGDNVTGQGGSLARFKIVDEYLYVVDSHNLNVFNIADLESPEVLDDVFVGFDIETIFNRGEHLFLGSMQGMYIYDITSPDKPEFISEFQHGTACDPVVVDGDYAYVTLRGGNFCGATESGLYIVDISTIEKPELEVIYPMDEPYGLGIKDDKLFICDGSSGLKVYDKSQAPNIEQLNHFEDIVTFDVIPLEEQLLMVGDGILYQYEYLNDDIRLISTFSLN